jgi:two-component system nitrogen regulation response regulator NtrX
MAHDILIVDDEDDIRMMLSGILEDEGYETREATDADSCLRAIGDRRPAVVILDIWMQGSRLDGLQVLEILNADHPGLPVVMISGHGTIETAVSAIKQGAYDFIEKPFKADRLLLIIQRAIETAQLKRENAELRMRAGPEMELVGKSLVIQQIGQAIQKVAPTGSRVMISGAPGTGKEVVARMIHASSPRSKGQFVVVNCAAMHPDRMEEELLGIEPFGDKGLRIGLFEQADGGTLLLDEVADMPLETQGKIVRVLQDQAFERVGGTRRVRVDVRVLASTNRDLTQDIADGRFREDLFYRLNVVRIRLPALRERREDIAPLAWHFMERAASAAGVAPRILGDDAIASLESYDWPGNVRQLRNVVDWLLIMASGEAKDPIRADMLPVEVSAVAPDSLRLDRSGEIMTLPLREAREMFERDYLIAQVTRFGGNVSKTAEFVGMERSALHRKLKSLGVGGVERAKA